MAEQIRINNRNTKTRFITPGFSLSQTVAENTPFSLNLTADVAVNWTLHGGADRARFTLASNTLSMTAKDFEVPVDANTDNVYEVTLKATDLYGFQKLVDVSVRVTDVGGQ